MRSGFSPSAIPKASPLWRLLDAHFETFLVKNGSCRPEPVEPVPDYDNEPVFAEN